MLQNTSEYSKYFKILHILKNTSKCFKILKNTLKYFRYFKIIQELQNITRHRQVHSVTRKPSLHRKIDISPITGLHRPVWLQEVEASRIFRHLANYGGKVVSRTHRPSLSTPPPPSRKYSWYSFLLEADSTPAP
jgi:hypothetical protein